MRKFLMIAATAMAAVALPAAATTVDFEAGPFGSQPEGFSAVGVPQLTFFSANGSGLLTGNFGTQGNGNSLAVLDDANDNFLIGKFASAQNSLSLGFGNDDPNFTNPGDLATLKLFSGATLVSTVTVVLNRDDIYNQFISYTGSSFNSFSFAYTDPSGSPFTGGGNATIGLIEVVDDITFSARAVPEPATVAVMALGLGMLGALRRRARA